MEKKQLIGKTKIFLIGDASYVNWMENVQLVDSIEESDVVFFTGGEDVSPELYNHQNLASYTNSRRDEQEVIYFNEALALNKKMFSVCRGFQFISVMSGAKMIQDFYGHGGSQNMVTVDGKQIQVSCSHHQMVYLGELPKEDYRLIGWVENSRDVKYLYDNDGGHVKMDKETEIVFYPKTNCLGVQFHPEYRTHSNDPKDIEYIQYCRNLFNDFLNNKLYESLYSKSN